MRRMTILLLLPLAVACLRCGADRAGMRDAISFITGELDLVLSAAVDLPGNEGENGRKAGRGLDKTNHDITGIQHGIGGRGTGGDNRVSYASVKKSGTGAVKTEQDRKGATGMKGGPAGGRGSYGAGKEETAPVQRNRDTPHGAGNKKDITAADRGTAAESGKIAAVKENRKTSSAGENRSGAEKKDAIMIADEGRSAITIKESATKEKTGTAGDAMDNNRALTDAGNAGKPSGYLVKPRVDEPAAR